MSKTSTSGPKNPPQLSSKSAWARGPPSASAQSPRSQSPAPTTPTAPSHQGSHSRKPSLLGQSVPFKDGVSIPRNNVGSAKQGPSVTFGSINEPSAPVSSSPASVPSIKTESVKSFGTLPATPSQLNGKPPVSSAASSSSSASKASTSSTPPSTAPSTSSTPPASTPPTPVKQKPKMDVRSLFKGPSASTPIQQESSSPSTRSAPLPSQPPPPMSQAPPSTAQSQPGAHPPPFVPRGAQGPNSGPPQPPRSPVFSRHPPNGAGGRPGGSTPAPGGQPPMGSPRMAPSQHAQAPPAGMPQQWGAYGYYDPNYQMAYHPQWYMHPPPIPHPHHPPPNGPPGPQGMPMSPRNAPPSLPPGTPQPAHAVPASPHIPHATPSHSHSGSISSPPAPTPGTPAANSANRLNTNASTFVPTTRRVTIKSSDGTEIKLPDPRKTSPAPVVPPSPNTDFTPSTPARKSVIRIESQADKEKRLEEEKARQAKEEQAKQDAAKAEKEKEEKAKKAEEEKERLRLEAEQQKKDQEEKARKAKEEEERLRLEAEQKKKDEEERAKQEAQKKLDEEVAKKKAEEESQRRKEAERKEAEAAAAKEAEAKAAKASTATTEPLEEGEVAEDAPAKDKDAAASGKENLRINTNSSMPPPSELPRRRPGPLDLSYTAKQPIVPPLPSALATARHIDDLGSVPYPDGVLSPKIELNANAQPGKYRYDRDFLLQFMSVCKEKPDSLPPLDAIGIESSDQNFSLSRGGSGRHRTSSNAGGPSRQNSVGLGSFGKQQFPTMGSFGTAPKTSEERFHASNARSISVSGAVPPFGRPSMTRTASQGGPSQLGTNRTRSRRGEKRGDGNKGPGVGQPSQLNPAVNAAGVPLEPVAPLEKSQNAWAPNSIGRKPTAVDTDSPAVVDRKVKSLLNKLTMEKFESISDQIIEWANKSEKEKDGRTLIQVIRLVFEKATDEATWSEMYARLCRKMMEHISAEVKDDGIKNSEGKPIAGGNLFRKYLLNRCQEDFERGWAAKDAAASAAASKAASDKAVQDSAAAAKTEGGEEEVALYSDEYYAAQKAKRRGLGLIKFIGELFKLQMLTERIMHECVRKLLRNVDNPEEEEIESLCKLLSTVGGMLDANTKARTHMDVYFTRMKELAKGAQVSSRMQFMLQDVIELRERKWVARNQVAAPATIAQVHEAAAKEKQAQEKESYNRTISMSRGGSKRGVDRGEAGADGWTVQGGGAPPPRPPSKAGDLSMFGKIGSTKGTPTTFGPSSVFNKKETKRESITRVGSSSNMFQMLQNAENAPEPSSLSKSSRPPSRKASMDLGAGGAPEPAAQRRKLVLQPRTKPTEGSATPQESRAASPEEEPQAEMSEADAKRKLAEDLKEFKGVRNLDEAEDYFISLPAAHHALLVDQFVSFAVESKEADAQLVADLFARAVSKSLCSSAAFEEGFANVAEFISDVAIDAPKAPNYFALMVKASGLGDEERTRVAQKSADYGDKLTQLFA